jgi:hypothetical protein
MLWHFNKPAHWATLQQRLIFLCNKRRNRLVPVESPSPIIMYAPKKTLGCQGHLDWTRTQATCDITMNWQSTNLGILNETIKQKRSKSMDTAWDKYHWLSNRHSTPTTSWCICIGAWLPGLDNLGDDHTTCKHHSAQHHKNMHKIILHPIRLWEPLSYK